MCGDCADRRESPMSLGLLMVSFCDSELGISLLRLALLSFDNLNADDDDPRTTTGTSEVYILELMPSTAIH